MRTIWMVFCFSCIPFTLFGQENLENEYDSVAASFVLDSVTVFAVRKGSLKASDFIRYTMEDTSLFYSFSLLKITPHQMYMDAKVEDKKGKQGKMKRIYFQCIEENCREQRYETKDSVGYFYDKKGQPISETYQMMMHFFTTPKRVCDIKVPLSPKGIAVFDSPKNYNQQKELVKRMIFAPHTIRVEVPFFGNKMKTNIFERPVADYYLFNVNFQVLEDNTPVYQFDIEIDSLKYPDWKKSILIKKMSTTFRAEDMAIIHRSYDLLYPGWLIACDMSIDIEMQEVEGKLYPKEIFYRGEWKFPTKGKDKSDIKLKFDQINKEECSQ